MLLGQHQCSSARGRRSASASSRSTDSCVYDPATIYIDIRIYSDAVLCSVRHTHYPSSSLFTTSPSPSSSPSPPAAAAASAAASAAPLIFFAARPLPPPPRLPATITRHARAAALPLELPTFQTRSPRHLPQCAQVLLNRPPRLQEVFPFRSSITQLPAVDRQFFENAVRAVHHVCANCDDIWGRTC